MHEATLSETSIKGTVKENEKVSERMDSYIQDPVTQQYTCNDMF